MTFDFIPLELYTLFFYYFMLFIIIVNFFKLNKGFHSNSFGELLVIILILYMGFRPVSGKYFVDMATYNYDFLSYQNGAEITTESDFLFHYFMKSCSKVMSVSYFFLICAFLYVFPLYLVSKKWFKEYWYYSFLLLAASFSFWAYGTNGIRNGIATSLFLLAISREKRIWQIILVLIAINFHKTMMLPALGFIFAQFYNKPKQLIAFWILCIPLSLIGGSLWEIFFASLGFGETDRLSYLTDVSANAKEFSNTGFRWDFLIYSGTAVLAGWYFIVKKKFEDKIYFWIFNTYVFANAFWILVIRANFSNRFAYLSWFMMALVFVYPFLKGNIFENQSRVFSQLLIIYFLFTYIMNVLLVK